MTLVEPVRALAPLAALVLTITTAGCSADQSPSVLKSGGVTLLVNDKDSAGMDSVVRGVLTEGPKRCLGVIRTGESTVMPVIWPKGTTLGANGDQLTLDDVTVRVGADIEGVGGELSDVPRSDYPQTPAECLQSGTKVVVLSSLK